MTSAPCKQLTKQSNQRHVHSNRQLNLQKLEKNPSSKKRLLKDLSNHSSINHLLEKKLKLCFTDGLSTTSRQILVKTDKKYQINRNYIKRSKNLKQNLDILKKQEGMVANDIYTNNTDR